MSKAIRFVLPVLAVAILVGAGSVASAQTNIPNDFGKVNYYANNVSGAPDATVRITNPGTASGNLCAMIYVFDNDQQLTACCGCQTTPNGLLTLSVSRDLTSNPLTGSRSNNGTIEIVSAAINNSPCDPTANVTPTAALRAWATHIDNPASTQSSRTGKVKNGGIVTDPYPITETEFTDATLGANELSFDLQAQCNFVHLLGSGNGYCYCGSGD